MSSLTPNMQIAEGLTLVRLLGQGSMGDVWVAEMAGRGQVAVKFINQELQKDPVSLERFKREWNVACTIESPHVVEMIDSGQTASGQHFIIMELLEGDDLDKMLEGLVGGMSPTATITLLEQLAQALDAAHAKGIVHRDIKPENVFLCKKADGLVVKVLDFGLAKSWEGGMNVTAAGVLVGTPYFMSPEQLLEQGKNIDHRADLWALGAVAYCMLFGEQPFDADNLTDLLVSVTMANYKPLSQVGGSPALEPFFVKAFQVDKTKRFNSASEMVQSLGVALGVRKGKSSGTEVMAAVPDQRVSAGLDQTIMLDDDHATPLYAGSAAAHIGTGPTQVADEPSHEPSHDPYGALGSTTYGAPLMNDAPVAPAHPMAHPGAGAAPMAAVGAATNVGPSGPAPPPPRAQTNKSGNGLVIGLVAVVVLAIVGFAVWRLAFVSTSDTGETQTQSDGDESAETSGETSSPESSAASTGTAATSGSAASTGEGGAAPEAAGPTASEDGETYVVLACHVTCLAHVRTARRDKKKFTVPAGETKKVLVHPGKTQVVFTMKKDKVVRNLTVRKGKTVPVRSSDG